MTDIVERLRTTVCGSPEQAAALIMEAADEIERLQEQLHYANGTADTNIKGHEEAEAEVERLHADLDAERERCALMAYREIIGAVDDVGLANTIRDAIRKLAAW